MSPSEHAHAREGQVRRLVVTLSPGVWASIHEAVRRLIAKTREVSRPRYWMLWWSYRSEIWQASRQRCRRCACQISERLFKSKPKSHGFETSRDLALIRLTAWWIQRPRLTLYLCQCYAANTWWRHEMETFSALLAICAGNSPVLVNSPHKGQWRGALVFSLICVWNNGWENNREAGDLRRYRAHYDVIVMSIVIYLTLLYRNFLSLGNVMLCCTPFFVRDVDPRWNRLGRVFLENFKLSANLAGYVDVIFFLW